MFTSKKALYLNKDFDRISPITNIESLYYELVKKDGDNYKIKRNSIAKHMHINFVINDRNINIAKISNMPDPGEYIANASINIEFNKTELPNPIINSATDLRQFEVSLFTVDSSKYINLQDLLKNYTPIHYFSSSIGNINGYIDNINSSITDISNYIADTSLVTDILISALYDHSGYYTWNQLNTSSLENNGIYNLIYLSRESSCLIKVLCISTNTIKNIISLDRAFNHSNNVSVELWVFHYDVSSNKIIYLKDEYGNEGNFDFRIAHKIYNNDLINSSFINNKLYFEPISSKIKFEGNGKFEDNEIYNSSNITFTENASNNIVVNCYNISISGSGNRIYNSSNTSTLVIEKSNNTIINCHDSSILVNGNSNYIINSSNLNVSLGNNNIIIGDSVGCLPNISTLENIKLFFNYSTSTALATDHTSSCTFYGGFGNDVSVYVDSLKTTNKY